MLAIVAALSSLTHPPLVPCRTAVPLSPPQAHAETLIGLVEVMSKRSPFECFCKGADRSEMLQGLRQRLGMSDEGKLPQTLVEPVEHAARLVADSLEHFGTVQYDRSQLYSNGILP